MISEALLRTAQTDSGGDAPLYLLTITHDDLPETLRFVRDFVPCVSRGETFVAFPFDVTPPGSADGGSSPASITMTAIGGEIPAALRALTTPGVMLVELVLAAAPDTVVDALPPFTFTAASGDPYTVSIDIADSAEDEREPLMQYKFDPSTAPALFR